MVVHDKDSLTHTVKETSQALGIGLNSTYELIRSNRLRAIRIGRRFIIPRREIEAFLERETEGDN